MSVFQVKGLNNTDEMRALFKGISVKGTEAWRPSRKGFVGDEIRSSTTQQDKSLMDVLMDSDRTLVPPHQRIARSTITKGAEAWTRIARYGLF